MAAKSSNNANFKDIFELVERMRLENKQDLSVAVSTITQNQASLEKKFDELEAGRLTRAEGDIRDLRVQNATVNTKLAVLVFIAAAIMSAVISVVIPKIVNK